MPMPDDDAGPVRNKEGYPIGLYDIMEEWAENRLPTSVAIRLGRFEDFAHLIKTTLEHGIALKLNLTPDEKHQAARFTQDVRTAPAARAHENIMDPKQ